MNLTTSPVGRISIPAEGTAATPTPPARWTRYWTSPIARFEYGTGSRMPLWPEATIPADRSLTGDRRPAVTYAGRNKDAAIEAARLLATTSVDVDFSFRNGRIGRASVNPAFAVLRDAHAGTFWLTPLQTTVRVGSEWRDAPHAIDGPAFAGRGAVLVRPTVLSATRDLVAVVGAETLIVPDRWTNAPDDSRIDA